MTTENTNTPTVSAKSITPNGAALQEMGKKIIMAHIATGMAYISMARHIRATKMQAEEVRKILIPLGFKNSRVSEISKIAAADEKDWNHIEAMNLGFKSALDVARGNVKQLADGKAAIALTEGIPGAAAAAGINAKADAKESETTATESTTNSTSSTPAEKLERALRTAAAAFVACDVRRKKIIVSTMENDIVFEITYKKPTKKTPTTEQK